MSPSEGITEKITSIVQNHDVVVFMKGSRLMPQCGFSGKVVQILDSLLPEYETVDVLSDPELRDGIKEYSSWPTIPQLYVKGEFVGGCDIIVDMYGNGDLHGKFGLEAPVRKIPEIRISDAAAARIREYAERNGGGELHINVDARFENSMGLSARQGGEIEVNANGVTVLMDASTAERADGLSIDVVETPNGSSFKIVNPNAPGNVNQMTPSELAKLLADGTTFEFLDVRTPDERAIASIAGAQLLDEKMAAHIETMPKDTMLVFHCHHGGRSQAAAEHFRDRGFTNTHSLVGGIEAWAVEIDPDVPRY